MNPKITEALYRGLRRGAYRVGDIGFAAEKALKQLPGGESVYRRMDEASRKLARRIGEGRVIENDRNQINSATWRIIHSLGL